MAAEGKARQGRARQSAGSHATVQTRQHLDRRRPCHTKPRKHSAMFDSAPAGCDDTARTTPPHHARRSAGDVDTAQRSAATSTTPFTDTAAPTATAPARASSCRTCMNGATAGPPPPSAAPRFGHATASCERSNTRGSQGRGGVGAQAPQRETHSTTRASSARTLCAAAAR